jgi:hypothetical protein
MAEGKRRTAAALGVASAGIVLGHWVTYLVDVPRSHARAVELARSGHAYLSVAGELATAMMAVTLAALFLGRVIHPEGPVSAYPTLARRLGLLQAGAFVAMELTERAVAGMGFGDLARGGLLPLGVLIQLVVALIGALLLRLVLRAADRVAAALPSPDPFVRAAALSFDLPPAPARRIRLPVATAGVRGPPSPVCC